MPKAAYKPKRVAPGYKIDTPCAERGRAIEPLFSLFGCLVSLREELRARTQKRQRKLQRYADKNGFILVGDEGSRDFRFLRRRPYNAAENAALVDAIAAETDDGSDCVELAAFHAAQLEAKRRGTVKHGGQR
jgi:hypothetical protein